jgi:chromosome segregation ATPase
VKEHAAAAADRLNAMGAKDGSVAKFIEQAELGKSSLASLISSADGANCSLKSLDENLAEKAAIVDQLAKSARAAARGLNALHTASEHSATLADNLEKSITQLKELTPTITAVQHSISTFDDRAAKINGAMAGIESDLRKAADALGDAAQDRVTTTAGAASEEYLVASDRSLTSPVFKFQK